MTLIGTLLRMFGAAILLIAVQFASVAAEAHVGHGHTPDSHHLQGHSHQGHGHDAAEGAAHAVSSGETAPVNRAVQAQPAAEAEATVQNAPGAPASVSDACVIGCCGTNAGCCGAALVEISPDLPPKACALRMGFARLIFVREVDPQGLRKPPRLFA